MSKFVSFRGVSWNKEDLEGCKQALLILLFDENVSIKTIKELENNGCFGSLWVDAVLEECGL